MQTVVKFIKNEAKSDRNKIVARTLRKVGFVDDRYLSSRGMPGFNEHWLVEIIRENQSGRGGSFVLKPIQHIADDDLTPMVHGMYDLKVDEDALILTPYDQSRYWVMSPESKKSLMTASSTDDLTIRALVINQGGDMWQRRQPPENIMQNEAKKLLSGLED